MMAESRQEYIKYGSIHFAELEKAQMEIEKGEAIDPLKEKYTSYYDLKNNVNPTQVSTRESNWLWARNNKYPEYNPKTSGKWILRVPHADVNAVWRKTKEAVQDGQLWLAKVSTSYKTVHEVSTGQAYVNELMVYTVDYSDVEDVVATLKYLETSGLKSSAKVITYESDDLSRSDIYYKNPRNRKMYSSDTIQLERREPYKGLYNILKYLFWYNLDTKKAIVDCKMKPSDVSQKKLEALWAVNNKYKASDCDPDKAGHWTITTPSIYANQVWDRVRKGIIDGDLWQSKLGNKSGSCSFQIWTKDYRNKADVIESLEYIQKAGLMAGSNTSNLIYRTDEESSTGLKTTGSEAVLQYDVKNIRLECSNNIFRCSLNPKQVTQRCEIKPTELTSCPMVLWAISDKYTFHDLYRTGYWTFYKPEETINATWDQIKSATEQGILWKSKIVKNQVKNSMYIVEVHSPDYEDKRDVIEILEFLEKSGLKPPEVIHYYLQPAVYGEDLKNPIYLSDTIRK